MNEQGPDEARDTFRRARDEWTATLDALRAVDGVGEGPTGYWGLSMGTVIGLPFVASEPRIDAAVLGLMGLGPDAEGGASRSLTLPVLFLVQWDDELVDRDSALRLFDTIGSERKTMHVNPGAHVEVPPAEIQASEDFFETHLGAEVPVATS